MKPAIATVGTFDGFHNGHRQLIARLIDEGRARGLESVAVTFGTHPLALVAPERTPRLLESRDELRSRLEGSGVDRVVWLDFDRQLASLTAAGFLAMLRERYGVVAVLMGYDNSFGSDRLRTPAEYVEAGRSSGVEVIFDDPYLQPETGIAPASSLLRRCLADGRVDLFTLYTGRHYSLGGTVAHGRRNGHRLGFPTLNIDFDSSRCIPARGVYAGSVAVGGRSYPAVINVGHNPTIADGNPVTVEAHAIGADLGNRYGEQAAVTFSRRLRDERRFDSLEQLREAIRADIDAARTSDKTANKP